MFCPTCKTEYQEGFYICPDCLIPVVNELPSIEDSGNKASKVETSDGNYGGKVTFQGDVIDVFETLNQSEVLIIESVLGAKRIPYHFPYDSFRLSGFLRSPARLSVPLELKGEVLEILKDLQMIS